MSAKVGRIYRDPSSNKFYAITAYLPKGSNGFRGPIYEGFNLETPNSTSYCAAFSVETEWELVDEDTSW